MSEKRKEAIQNVFNSIKFTREFYKEQYVKILEKYNKDKKHIEENMKAGSPLYKQKMEEVEKEKEEALTTERNKGIELLLDVITELETLEKARVRSIDEVALAKLDKLQAESLTKAEIEVLCEQYGNKNYWTDRKLSEIATKSGIANLKLEIEPNLEDKLNILNQLGENAMKFLQEYNGTPQYKVEVLLADSVIERAKSSYTANTINYMASDYETVQSTMARIKSMPNDMEKAIAFSRALRNANDNVRNMLIAKASVEPTFNDLVVNLSGAKEEIRECRMSGGMTKYVEAEKLMNEALAGSRDEVATLIEQNPNNKFFRSMVEAEAESNDKFRSAINVTVNTAPQTVSEE